MKIIKIGIIGAGRMSILHVRGFKALQDVEIAAVADTNQERVNKLITEEGLSAKPFSDYKEMLGHDLDGVSIITPNFLHEAMAVDALNAGLDVLCEKPMAPTVVECERMNEAAQKNNRILMINQSFRYNALFIRLKELLESSEIGDIFHARFIRFGARTPDKGWSPGATWFVDKKAGGGITNDIGIHLIDYANWCFGKHTKVWGVARTLIKGNTADDNAEALIEYEKGPTVSVSLSWTAPFGHVRYEFFGSKGTIMAAGSEITIRYAGQDEEKKISIEKAGLQPSSYAHFIKCMRDRNEPLSSGNEAKHAVEIADAICGKEFE